MELEKADFCMDQQIQVMLFNMDTVSLHSPEGYSIKVANESGA